MASWLIRIVSSSGKSIGKRRAICSGLHALAHRRFCRWPSRRFFQDTAGPVTGMPLGATTMPANLSSTYVRKVALRASLVGLGRRADRSACHWAIRRAILQPTAASGCVAPQLTGDRRGGSTEPAPDLLHGMTLYPEKRNLLALHRRQIPPRERLCRGSEHRWWHAARLSEPSGSYRLRHTGFERSIFAAQTSGDPQPKSTLFIAPRHRG